MRCQRKRSSREKKMRNGNNQEKRTDSGTDGMEIGG